MPSFKSRCRIERDGDEECNSRQVSHLYISNDQWTVRVERFTLDVGKRHRTSSEKVNPYFSARKQNDEFDFLVLHGDSLLESSCLGTCLLQSHRLYTSIPPVDQHSSTSTVVGDTSRAFLQRIRLFALWKERFHSVLCGHFQSMRETSNSDRIETFLSVFL